jgi:hypothetical protein
MGRAVFGGFCIVRFQVNEAGGRSVMYARDCWRPAYD